MRVQIFQHERAEGPGAILPWLRRRGLSVGYTHWHAGERPPALTELAGLAIMGGGMSVNDEVKHPWLVAEKEYVLEAIERGVPVLGVCLGAQLIASALGGRVHRNPHREIGWWPVSRVSGAERHPLGSGLPEASEVFHWHGETFTLPPKAVHLLRSAACENQAFAVGRRVLGVQFHPETTEESARRLIAEETGDFPTGPYVQSPAEMLSSAERFAGINRLLEKMLDALWPPQTNPSRLSEQSPASGATAG
jgi:GMP synthase-like glutamine amidotransferase